MKWETSKKVPEELKELFETVVSILDEIDPVGIVTSASKAGFPTDREYLPEAKEIVVYLKKGIEVKELESEVERIFDYYFSNPDVPKEFYVVAARRILNAWYAFQGLPTNEFPEDIELPKHPLPIKISID